MKKLFLFLLVVATILCIIIAPKLVHDSRPDVENSLYTNYEPQTPYESSYLVSDYVDEQMNATKLFKGIMLGSLINSEDILKGNSFKFAVPSFIFDSADYSEYIQNNQYIESAPIYLTEVYDNEAYNYLYTGYLPDGSEVTGRLAIFEYNNNVALAISLLDEAGNPDPQLATLLSDDSNSEYLMYLIMEEIQSYLNSNMEPNLAAETYFDNSLEQLAGSFSYHALTTKYILENGGSDYVMSHTEVINITKNDSDGIFINRSL